MLNRAVATAARRVNAGAIGSTRAGPAPRPTEAGASHLECPACGKLFLSTGDLRNHASRIHGVRHRARLYVDNDTCPACLTCFWSRERLVYHLKKAKFCLGLIVNNCSPMPQREANALDAQSAAVQRGNLRVGFSPRVAMRPAIRAAGPFPAWAGRA